MNYIVIKQSITLDIYGSTKGLPEDCVGCVPTLCIRDLEVKKNAKSGSSLSQAIFVLLTKK